MELYIQIYFDIFTIYILILRFIAIYIQTYDYIFIYTFEILIVIVMAVLNDHFELYHLSYEVREVLLAMTLESCLSFKCVLVKDEQISHFPWI